MRFEHRHEPLLPKHQFLRRLGRHSLLAVAIVTGSLIIGIIGYHLFEGWSWLDSLLEASMILAGMGPVKELKSDGGKLFASLLALYSGVALLTTTGVLFAPGWSTVSYITSTWNAASKNSRILHQPHDHSKAGASVNRAVPFRRSHTHNCNLAKLSEIRD